MSNYIKGWSFKDRKILIVSDRVNKEGVYECYNSKGYVTMTPDEINELHKKPRSSEYVPIDVFMKGHTLKDNYVEFRKLATELKKASNGKINMFRTGTLSKTAINILYTMLNEKKISFEPIQDYECEFFQHCGGGIRVGEPYNGPMYLYDVCSHFPSIYSDVNFLIPIKAGVLKTITQKEFEDNELKGQKYIFFGVYKAIVSDVPAKYKKALYINRHNYYTHYELRMFRKYGATIKIIEEPNNWLYYDRKACLTGSEIFGDYVKLLFPLKHKGYSACKDLLNHLWGILTKQKTNIFYVGFDEEFIQPPDCEIIESLPIMEENKMMIKVQFTNTFQQPLARMKPFFLARCREVMINHMEPIIEHVYYSHTDSIITSVKMEVNNIKLDPNEPDVKKVMQQMGKLLYKGYCPNGWVKNASARTPDTEFIME